MRRRRVSALGLNLTAPNELPRWWEQPLAEEKLLPPARKLIVAAKVDCHWRPQQGDSETRDSLDRQRQKWEAEYARLTEQLAHAYEGDGVDHADDELYDGQSTLGSIIEHYDHDLEGRRKSRRKARMEARRIARLEGNADEEDGHSSEEDARAEAAEEALEAAARKSGMSDGASAVRHAQVVRQNKQAGHPFTTLALRAVLAPGGQSLATPGRCGAQAPVAAQARDP
eukprot:CAMPEP_0174726134 /NCGR_PEP_ID=MMETSP1094-20130205/47098_1 /TAXON_ID=156173 /ORGANISM="Chrysochromulina brevifilum, Strain UTEX LB 985" /LENGTH=226 /DNA_ID=CAMNT_0015927657 /DNA_START=38 /DNA_END=716 /DNA_ORIENTATION=+